MSLGSNDKLTRRDFTDRLVFGAAQAACPVAARGFGSFGSNHQDHFAKNLVEDRLVSTGNHADYRFSHRAVPKGGTAQDVDGKRCNAGSFLGNDQGAAGFDKRFDKRFGLVHVDVATRKPASKGCFPR